MTVTVAGRWSCLCGGGATGDVNGKGLLPVVSHQSFLSTMVLSTKLEEAGIERHHFQPAVDLIARQENASLMMTELEAFMLATVDHSESQT